MMLINRDGTRMEAVQKARYQDVVRFRFFFVAEFRIRTLQMSVRRADLYLTGELAHHETLAYKAAGSSVIVANHTNTER